MACCTRRDALFPFLLLLLLLSTAAAPRHKRKANKGRLSELDEVVGRSVGRCIYRIPVTMVPRLFETCKQKWARASSSGQRADGQTACCFPVCLPNRLPNCQQSVLKVIVLSVRPSVRPSEVLRSIIAAARPGGPLTCSVHCHLSN
jgi:hypothetical protein